MLMTVIAGKGSPGATTLALGMTLTWPAPVLLAEADPAGGSIRHGYGRGIDLAGRGLVGWRVAQRRMNPIDAIWANVIQLEDDRWLLPGVENPTQAARIDFAALTQSLAGLGLDVIVDAGRTPSAARTDPLLARSDRVVATLRSTLASVNAAQGAVAAMAGTCAAGAICSVLVGAGRPYPEADVRAAMSEVAPLVDSVAWDPAPAAVLSDGAMAGRAFHASPLMRSIQHTGRVLARPAEERLFDASGTAAVQQIPVEADLVESRQSRFRRHRRDRRDPAFATGGAQ